MISVCLTSLLSTLLCLGGRETKKTWGSMSLLLEKHTHGSEFSHSIKSMSSPVNFLRMLAPKLGSRCERVAVDEHQTSRARHDCEAEADLEFQMVDPVQELIISEFESAEHLALPNA